MAMNTHKLQPIIGAIASDDLDRAAIVTSTIAHGARGAWRENLTRLAGILRNLADGHEAHRPFTILTRGNSKLPFVAFSALPGDRFCPGAGECLSWCYSFRAWRYPAAFCRQVQNTAMLQQPAGRAQITAALARECKLAARRGLTELTFRLYVDGDFRSVADVGFWMRTLSEQPMVNAYGYSKSFGQLVAYQTTGGKWAPNYRLNLSGGHKHAGELMRRVASLPITRGEFAAVSVGRKVRSTEHGTRDMNKLVREAAGAAGMGKVFPCPGKCGECTPKGHACGSDRFAGVTIAIAVH